MESDMTSLLSNEQKEWLAQFVIEREDVIYAKDIIEAMIEARITKERKGNLADCENILSEMGKDYHRIMERLVTLEKRINLIAANLALACNDISLIKKTT